MLNKDVFITEELQVKRSIRLCKTTCMHIFREKVLNLHFCKRAMHMKTQENIDSRCIWSAGKILLPEYMLFECSCLSLDFLHRLGSATRTMSQTQPVKQRRMNKFNSTYWCVDWTQTNGLQKGKYKNLSLCWMNIFWKSFYWTWIYGSENLLTTDQPTKIQYADIWIR